MYFLQISLISSHPSGKISISGKGWFYLAPEKEITSMCYRFRQVVGIRLPSRYRQISRLLSAYLFRSRAMRQEIPHLNGRLAAYQPVVFELFQVRRDD